MALSREELKFYLEQTELALDALESHDSVMWNKSNLFVEATNVRNDEVYAFQAQLIKELGFDEDWFEISRFEISRFQQKAEEAHKQVISFIKKAFFSES